MKHKFYYAFLFMLNYISIVAFSPGQLLCVPSDPAVLELSSSIFCNADLMATPQ
jgi:hypothetical protein